MNEPKQSRPMPDKTFALPTEFDLPPDWQVFGPVNRSVVLPKETLANVPEWIEAEGRKIFPQKVVAAQGNLDLAPLIGGTMTGRSAYVYIPFALAQDQVIRLGFGADFWFDAYLDGESICDNLESGSWNHPPTATDYIETVSLVRGRHVLAIRFISGGGSSSLCAAALHGQGVRVTGSRKFKVDFSRSAGVMKPQLHGVNHGPLCFSGNFDFTAAHKEMGFSRVRPSEPAGTAPETVDVHAIFPLFQAEADDPRNYRFLITDEYLQSILDAGEGLYYRLGETAAPDSQGKHGFHPPADHAKWARICVNIIRHYNDGWANGFHHGIEYWEIWNEASAVSNWTGTKEEYFDLYAVAAQAIKAHNPRLKVGGGGASGAGAYGRAFIEFCAREKVPLDFFAWHAGACRPEEFMLQARENRRLLDAAGFSQTESHLNRWSYAPPPAIGCPAWDTHGAERLARCTGPEGAAFDASSLVFLHDAPVAAAHSFWGRDGSSGARDFFGVRLKPFYALKAFGQMLDVPHRVFAEGGVLETGLAVLAGHSTERHIARILLSNFQHPDEPMKLYVRGLPWTGRSVCQTQVVDAARNLEVVQTDEHEGSDLVINLRLPPGTVMLLDIKRMDR